MQAGIGTVNYAGYRRFLPLNSAGRQKTFQVQGQTYDYVGQERRRNPLNRTHQRVLESCAIATATNKPFRGHKYFPLQLFWRGFRFEDYIVADFMHDVKCMTLMVVKVLVGKGKHGFYKSWTHTDSKHRQQCKLQNVFPHVWDDGNPLPWRLSKDACTLMDQRVRNIRWPHGLTRCCKGEFSFWIKPEAFWRTSQRVLAFQVISYSQNIP